jgi:hypothetical protein
MDAVAEQLRGICQSIVNTIKTHCLPAVVGKEVETIFFKKLMGDYYRGQFTGCRDKVFLD